MKAIRLEISPGLKATITYEILDASWKTPVCTYIKISDIFVGNKIDISPVVSDRLLFGWEEEILELLKEDNQNENI